MCVDRFDVFKGVRMFEYRLFHRIQCLAVNGIVYGIHYSMVTRSRELVDGDDRRDTAARPVMVGGQAFFIRRAHFSTSEQSSIFQVVWSREFTFLVLHLMLG
jgi:hypothetical protein